MLAQTSPEMPEGVLSAERLAEKHTEDEMNGQWSLFEGSQPLKIDKIVGSLMEQQTRIIDLECLLEIEREENAEYHKVCGDLEDLRKEERNDET